MEKITDKDVVSAIWKYRNEGRPWGECTKIFNFLYKENLMSIRVKTHFVSYFAVRSGVMVYTKCPLCGKGEVIPKLGKYGYFISCTEYPGCNYNVAVRKDKKRDRRKKDGQTDKEKDCD